MVRFSKVERKMGRKGEEGRKDGKTERRGDRIPVWPPSFRPFPGDCRYPSLETDIPLPVSTCLPVRRRFNLQLDNTLLRLT